MQDIIKILLEKNLNPQSKKVSSSLQSWMNDNVMIGFEIECYAPEEFSDGRSGKIDYDAALTEPEILDREASNTLTTTINFKPPNPDPKLFPEKQAKQLYDFLDGIIPRQIIGIGRNELFNDFESDMPARARRNMADGIFDRGNFYDFYQELIEKQELYIESLEDDFEKDEDVDYSPVDDADLEKLADLFAQDIDGLIVEIEDVDLDDSWEDSSEKYSTTVVGSTVKVITTFYQIRLEYPEISTSGKFSKYHINKLLDRNGLDYTLFTLKPDASLRSNQGGVEIILSKPLPYAEAFEIYEKLTGLLRDNDFTVDTSTGMHMSFSVKGLNNLDEVNWLKVMILSGTDYIQKSFNRLNNIYVANLNKTLNTMLSADFSPNSAEFNKLEYSIMKNTQVEKYVNLSLRDFQSHRGRIEYRVPGGEDTLNYEKVKQSVDRVLVAVYYGMKQNKNLYYKEYLKKLYNITSGIMGQRPGRSNSPKMSLGAYVTYKKSLMGQTIREIETTNNTLKSLYNTQYTTDQMARAFPKYIDLDYLHVFFNGIDRELLKLDGSIPDKLKTIIKTRFNSGFSIWYNTETKNGTIYYSTTYRAVIATKKLNMTDAYTEMDTLLDYYVERALEIFGEGNQPVESFADFIRRYNT